MAFCSAELLVRLNVPTCKFKLPVNVFAPASCKVPAPIFVSPKPSELAVVPPSTIAPLMVRVFAVTFAATFASKIMVPVPRLKFAAPRKLRLPASRMLLLVASVTSLPPVFRYVVPFRFPVSMPKVPVPSEDAVALPPLVRMRVPLPSVTPPELVLVPERVVVPVLSTTRDPEPEMLPAML